MAQHLKLKQTKHNFYVHDKKWLDTIQIVVIIDPSTYRHTENSAQTLPLKKGEELSSGLFLMF